MTSPIEFIQQVRAEAAKVTWPSRREVLITTAMVFVFAIVASIFFLIVDRTILFVLTTFLNFLR